MKFKKIALITASVFCGIASQQALAACSDVTRTQLVAAAATAAAANTGGYGLGMWVTFVDEAGAICNIVTSGYETGGGAGSGAGVFRNKAGEPIGNTQWLGSRVISAQKANTANAFSVDDYAISTANLYTAVASGSLFGLQHSNPVDASRAYQGTAANFGTATDPLVGQNIGGVNVFGGGLALYSSSGKKVGAIGVSGDTSCRDHAFAWEVRDALSLNTFPAAGGITTFNAQPLASASVGAALKTTTGSAAKGDELIFDVTNTGNLLTAILGNASVVNNVTAGTGGAAAKAYWAGWSQPACPNVVLHRSYIAIQ